MDEKREREREINSIQLDTRPRRAANNIMIYDLQLNEEYQHKHTKKKKKKQQPTTTHIVIALQSLQFFGMVPRLHSMTPLCVTDKTIDASAIKNRDIKDESSSAFMKTL
jgi:hypothetical protein